MLAIIKATLGPILDSVLNLIPDKNARDQARENFEIQMLSALTGLVQGQLEINKIEAGHKSIFVAGWRPAVGWVCVAGLSWNFLLQPLVAWILFATGTDLDKAPQLDIGDLMVLLAGMLGLGGLRTYEKRLGVASDTIGGTK